MIADIFTRELLYDEDVRIEPTVTGILALDLPPGRYVVTATICIANRTDALRTVDVWLTAVPPPSSLAGPRASTVALGPGGVASITVGPVATITDRALAGQLVAQHDGTRGEDVWALEGTPVVNRAGATAILALGTDPPVTRENPGPIP